MKTLMTMLVVLLFGGTAQAATIHGACDDLQGTAGGAYGLCVAICEVPAEDEDCMPTFVDGVLVADSLDNCRPATMKLVEKYQEKANDIPLPCGEYQSSVSCPCPEPDVDVTLPYSCSSQSNGSSGLIQRFPLDGSLTLFTVRPIKDGWVCRTVTRDGVRTVLPIPGAPGEGTEVDACLDVYNSYCP